MINFDARNFVGVAFDFDGIIADSERAHFDARVEAYRHLAHESGDQRFLHVPRGIHDAAARHGTNPEEINAWIMRSACIIGEDEGVDAPEVQALVQVKNEVYREVCKKGLPIVTFAPQLVRDAKHAMGGNIAIATTAHEWEVIPTLKRHKLLDCFDGAAIVTREQTERPKPDPEAYCKVLGSLGLEDSPRRAVAIEDSPRGIEAAARAGLTTIGVATTHTTTELKDQEGHRKADAIYGDLGVVHRVMFPVPRN